METERLILRGAQPGDDERLFELRNSEYVLRYNCMQKVTKEQWKEQVTKYAESQDVFCIQRKEDGRVIGMIDLDPDSLRYGVNALCLSYYLGEEYANKGYMSEALREMIRYAFEERSAEVLTVRAFKDNTASIKLIEKLGFIHEGCLRNGVKGYGDIIHDDMIYSILREDYLA
jgi:[ribosomal protein S5]-alanine N-acetyltransferase